MKKNVLFLILFSMISPALKADHGGAVAAGVAAGLFTGIATSAIASSNASKSNKAEAQALKAREEVEQIKRDQDRERVEQLRREADRREADRKDEQIRQLNEHLRQVERQTNGGQNQFLLYVLFGFIILLTAAVGVLGLVLFRHKR